MQEQHDNGILAGIRGEEIAAGNQRLPPPGPGQSERLSVEVDTLYNGRVLITYRLQSYKRGKSHYWRWAASRAAAVLY